MKRLFRETNMTQIQGGLYVYFSNWPVKYGDTRCALVERLLGTKDRS